MLYKWPPPTKADEFSTVLRQMADRFVETVRSGKFNENSNERLDLLSEQYVVEDIGGTHNGKFVAFNTSSGNQTFVQSMFLVSINAQTWSGQFTGTPENWTNALNVLRTAQPIMSE